MALLGAYGLRLEPGEDHSNSGERFMKAALALLILYVGTFFVALGDAQPGAQTPGAEESVPAAPAAIDPAKEADIRSLMELAGSAELLKSAGERASAQYMEKIQVTMQNRERAQALATAFQESFKEHFSTADMSAELVRRYDKHFTAEEIRGLLKFYGSPLGQKFASETPKMSEEMQMAVLTRSQNAAKEAWQTLRARNPELSEQPRQPFRAQRLGRRARP